MCVRGDGRRRRHRGRVELRVGVDGKKQIPPYAHTYVCTRCSSVNRKTRQDEVEHMKQQTQQQKQQHKNNNEKRQLCMFIDIALHYPSLSVSQLNLSFTLLHSLFLSHRTWGGCCCCCCRLPAYVCMYVFINETVSVCLRCLPQQTCNIQSNIHTDRHTNKRRISRN